MDLPPSHLLALQDFNLITDFTPDNGSTAIIPGSQINFCKKAIQPAAMSSCQGCRHVCPTHPALCNAKQDQHNPFMHPPAHGTSLYDTFWGHQWEWIAGGE